MSDTTYEYFATVARVVDGDTVWLNLYKEYTFEVDFGFSIKDTIKLIKEAKIDFRLHAINAPEMKLATRAAGEASKSELERLLSLGRIRVVTYKQGKYGRYIADLYVKPEGEEEIFINQYLVEHGFAKDYMV